MEGLSQEVLSFLIDIQQHGASQLKALSSDFTTLGATADRISGQLRTMEAQLAKTGTTATAAGAKVADSQKGAADAMAASAGAADRASAAQRANAAAAGQQAASVDRLTGATKVGTAAQAASTKATGEGRAAQDALVPSVNRSRGAISSHSGALNAHGKALEKVKATTHEFASSMNMVSLPLLAVGGLSIKMGMDFQAAMSRLHTQAGYAEDDVKSLEGTVIKAAPAMRRTPTELAEGLYHVASVGIPAAQAMKLVEAASIGANVGGSDFSTTMRGLTEIVKSLHQPATAAIGDMGMLNEIVGAGDVHMEELVSSLGKVLPQAQNFGLNLRDVGAAMDIMTSRGIDANMAATRLGMSFHLLASPTTAGQKAFDTIGLSAHDLAEKLRSGGLVPAIADLKKHLDDAFPERGSKPLGLAERRHELDLYTKSLEASGVSGKKLQKDQQAYASMLSHGGTAAVEQARVLSQAFGGGRQSTGILTLVQNLDDLRKTYNKLPEGQVAIKKLMAANAVWEKTSQASYDHVKASFSSAMTSLGKNIGPPVLEGLTKVAEDVQHISERFEELPPHTKHLIEALVGVLAVAGPVAGTMSKMAGAAAFIEKLKGSGGGLAHIASSGPGTGSAGPLGGVGAISGFFGPEAPGSKVNPLAVMVMDPNSSGGSPLGGGAAKNAEKDAVKAAEKDVLPVAEGAGGAEALSLAEKAKGLLGKGLKGGMIALGGNAVADLTGTIVGGKTGKAISTIGGDAATGAGLGTLVGPEGTIAGAAVGALVGGLKIALSQPSFGDKMAATLGSGMTPAAQKAIKDSFDAQHNYEQQTRATRTGGAAVSSGRGGGGVGPNVKPRVEISNKEAYAGGAAAAAAVEHKAESFKHMDLKATFGEFESYMAKLPARSRSAGIQSIIEWTRGMESQGKLPKQATDTMITDIEKRWPQYGTYLHQVGLSSIRELIKTMENSEAAEAAKKQVQAIGSEWQQLAPLLKKDGGNVEKEWSTTLDFLVSQTYSKVPGVSKAAHLTLDSMRKDTSKMMSGWEQDMAERFRSAGSKGATEYGKGMTALVGAIKAGMHAGLIATQQGDALILSEETKEAHELGLRPDAVKGGHAPAGATGMRVPGAGLMDTVPILGRRGGVRGIVAPGELLIANRHTEARVNEKLAPFGTTLAHEVLGEGRPHSAPMFAKGGLVVRGPVSTFGPPGEAASGTAYGSTSAAPGIAINPHGGSNWNDALAQSLAGKVARVLIGGHSANLKVIDKGPSAIGSRGPRLIDVTGAGASAMGINPSGFPTDAIGEAIFGEGGTAVGSATTAAFHPIKRVLAHMQGLIGRTVQAGLDRSRAQANKRLRALAAKAASSTGALGGAATGPAVSGGSFDPSQVGTFDGIQVAKWIIPELLFGRAHGWAGPITSGIRLGFDPHAPSGSEHALDVYPGGAVDFGGMVDPAGLANRAAFIRATASYIGQRLLTPIGFRDDGHMSGTGHALGGRIPFAGAFAKGGSVTAHRPTLALFGEHGPETAHFVPHYASSGISSGEIEAGIVAPSSKTEKLTEAYNPSTEAIEEHTAAEWRHIRAEHALHKTKKARAHRKGKAVEHEREVSLGGVDVGAILDTHTGAISLGSDAAIGKLSAALWKKVLATVEKLVANTSAGAGVATQLAGVAAHDAAGKHPSARIAELASKSITGASKTVMTVLRNADEEHGVAAGNTALGQIHKLIHDAQISHNKALVAGLTKNIDTTLKTTGSRIVKVAEAVAPGQAAGADSHAVSQLVTLMGRANREGRFQIEAALGKSAAKVVTNWHAAIQSKMTTAVGAASAVSALGHAKAAIATFQQFGIGPAGAVGRATAGVAGAENKGLHDAQQKAAATAVTEMKGEVAKLHGILAKVEAREVALVKKANASHSRRVKKRLGAMAAALQSEVKEIQSQIGEVETSRTETEAQAQAQELEYQQQVAEAQQALVDAAKEAVLNSINQVTEAIEHATAHLNLEGTLTEGKLHREGKDFAGLEEDKAKQEGVLTPSQIAQAKDDLSKYIANARAQITSDESLKAYDESQLPGLTGSDRTAMENSIDNLAAAINGLENGIYDQTKSTEKLTEATNTAAKTFGGTVGFSFNGNQYVVGQSSNSGDNVMSGV